MDKLISKKYTKNEKIVIGTKALGEIFGVDRKWIEDLTNRGILEKQGRGTYDLIKNVNLYVTHLKAKGSASEDAKSVVNEKDRQEMLLKSAKREKAEMELQLLKGQLVSTEDVKQVYGGMVLTFRSKMLSMPTKIAPKLIGQQNLITVQDILSEEIYAALRELSNSDVNEFIKPKVDSDE